MSDKILSKILYELNILELTLEYLKNNKDKLINYGIEQLLNIKSYFYVLNDNRDEIALDLANDIDLIIRYCEYPNDELLSDGLSKEAKYYQIYCEFYNHLISLVQKDKNIDEFVKDNLMDSFNYLKSNYCR